LIGADLIDADLTGSDLIEEEVNLEITSSGVSHNWVTWNGSCSTGN
jgi:hypothetical protein